MLRLVTCRAPVLDLGNMPESKRLVVTPPPRPPNSWFFNTLLPLMDIFFQFPQDASTVFLPFFKIIICIRLIAPGLSCGTQDPSLQLLVAEFLVVACRLLAVAWGI